MPDQLSFAGFEATPLPTDSVFFALFPDAAAAARMAHLAQCLRHKHGLKGRPLAAQRFHVSLHYAANHLPRNIVAAANEAASRIAMPPFRIALDHAKSLGRDGHSRPLVLCGGDGVAGLVRFQHMLAMAMEGAGLGRWIGPGWRPRDQRGSGRAHRLDRARVRARPQPARPESIRPPRALAAAGLISRRPGQTLISAQIAAWSEAAWIGSFISTYLSHFCGRTPGQAPLRKTPPPVTRAISSGESRM